MTYWNQELNFKIKIDVVSDWNTGRLLGPTLTIKNWWLHIYMFSSIDLFQIPSYSLSLQGLQLDVPQHAMDRGQSFGCLSHCLLPPRV